MYCRSAATQFTSLVIALSLLLPPPSYALRSQPVSEASGLEDLSLSLTSPNRAEVGLEDDSDESIRRYRRRVLGWGLVTLFGLISIATWVDHWRFRPAPQQPQLPPVKAPPLVQPDPGDVESEKPSSEPPASLTRYFQVRNGRLAEFTDTTMVLNLDLPTAPPWASRSWVAVPLVYTDGWYIQPFVRGGIFDVGEDGRVILRTTNDMHPFLHESRSSWAVAILDRERLAGFLRAGGLIPETGLHRIAPSGLASLSEVIFFFDRDGSLGGLHTEGLRSGSPLDDDIAKYAVRKPTLEEWKSDLERLGLRAFRERFPDISVPDEAGQVYLMPAIPLYTGRFYAESNLLTTLNEIAPDQMKELPEGLQARMLTMPSYADYVGVDEAVPIARSLNLDLPYVRSMLSVYKRKDYSRILVSSPRDLIFYSLRDAEKKAHSVVGISTFEHGKKEQYHAFFFLVEKNLSPKKPEDSNRGGLEELVDRDGVKALPRSSSSERSVQAGNEPTTMPSLRIAPQVLSGESVGEILRRDLARPPSEVALGLYLGREEVKRQLRDSNGVLRLNAQLATDLSGAKNALGGILIDHKGTVGVSQPGLIIMDSDLSNTHLERAVAVVKPGATSGDILQVLPELKVRQGDLVVFESESELIRGSNRIRNSLTDALNRNTNLPRVLVGEPRQIEAMSVATFRLLADGSGLPEVIYLGIHMKFRNEIGEEFSLVVWTQV